MSSQSSSPTARRHASATSTPARARLEPFLPEEISKPATVKDLVRKIEIILKTATDEQFHALDVLSRIVREQIGRDGFEAANVAYYNRLVHQVVTGRRPWERLTARIDEVPGVSEPIARIYDLPLCGTEAWTTMAAEPVRGWRRYVS